MKNTLFSLSGAALLLLSVSCSGSDSSDVDASIANDARLEPDSAGGTGGSGPLATGGAGGASATGGSGSTGGSLASGGMTGGGGQATGTGGSGGQVCGGIAALPCAKGQFCEYAFGECNSIADGTGTCAARPEACATIYQPVCGCDGKTYGNDCERQAAGVSKRADGTCSSEGKMCGGIAGLPCDKGQFCEYALGECSSIADGTGTCALRPDLCPTIYQPVCGCDGKTYGNDCERQAAGVSKRADGTCSSEGKMCGGIAGLPCDKGQLCDLAPGDCGTIADGAGTCVVTADIGCLTLYRPVCGCDGKTYPNDCNRQVAGVLKAADGVCPSLDGGVDR